MKKLYFTIFILTIADATLTMLGIRGGYISEANFILQGIYHASPILATIMIIVAVGIALTFMYRYRYKIRWMNTALIGLLVVKIYVIGLHFNWISQIL